MKGLRLKYDTVEIVITYLIFTLWPEWRDYDKSVKFTIRVGTFMIFTLWPEWRDYDLPQVRPHGVILRSFLPCDLNEGITTPEHKPVVLEFVYYFYLVTWMKGLRLAKHKFQLLEDTHIFTLWPEWRDYDKIPCLSYAMPPFPIFTLWPEWRDYDPK